MYDDVKNKPYNLDPVSWISAKILIDDGFRVENQPWYKKWFKSEEQQTLLFWCSAMVAYFYIQIGLLDKDCFSLRVDMTWLMQPTLKEEKSIRGRRIVPERQTQTNVFRLVFWYGMKPVAVCWRFENIETT